MPADMPASARFTAPPKTRKNVNSRPETQPDTTTNATMDAARRRLDAAQGESRPPADDYSTPAAEPAQYPVQYTAAPQQQQQQPQPNPYGSQPQYPNPSQGVQSQTPQQYGDSYGQQYPQPHTEEAYPVTGGHRRLRARDRSAEGPRLRRRRRWLRTGDRR